MQHRSTTAAPALRCAVYARVSSDKQDVENSLDRQLRACREWAERNGHNILDRFIFSDEARSGASMLARPAFQRMLTMLRGRDALPFDAVLVDDDSRLDRGGHMATIVEAFQVRRIRLVCVDSGRDLTEESERLLVHVKSGLNEHYLHELARRTRNGLASKVRHGFHAGGRTYGYRLVPEWPADVPLEKRDRENRIGTRIEIDDAQGAIVLRIFTEYAAGAGFRGIAHGLNADGVPSSRGKASWDASGVRTVLLNPRYIGDWTWNRRRWQKTPESLLTDAERDRAKLTGRHPRRPTLRAAEDLIEHRNEALRIVSGDVWGAVQARFKGRTRTVRGGRGYQRTRHPLAGLMMCECGGSIGLHTATRKGHSYTRLRCTWHQNRGPDVCRNDAAMRLEPVAERLLAYVAEELRDPARVAEALEMVNRKVAERARAKVPAGKVAALRSEVAQLDAEVSRLVDALAKGTAYAAISAALAAKDARMTAARAELAALTVPAPPPVLPRVSAADVRTRLTRLWDDVRQLDGDRARLALAQIFGGIVVKPLLGTWESGWKLEMQTRPWAVCLPRAAVVQLVGCGGALASIYTTAEIHVPRVDTYARGPRRRRAV